MEELIQQLEFFRDIGVTMLDVPKTSTKTAVKTATPVVTKPEPDQRVPPEVMGNNKSLDNAAALQLIREDIGNCQRCKLAPSRTNIVFGSGNPNAELVFVGEAPGFDEDKQGLPFVGRAGQL